MEAVTGAAVAPGLTGRSTSPGIFDLIAALGREESLGMRRGSGGGL
jgi:hypothetical protein